MKNPSQNNDLNYYFKLAKEQKPLISPEESRHLVESASLAPTASLTTKIMGMNKMSILLTSAASVAAIGFVAFNLFTPEEKLQSNIDLKQNSALVTALDNSPILNTPKMEALIKEKQKTNVPANGFQELKRPLSDITTLSEAKKKTNTIPETKALEVEAVKIVELSKSELCNLGVQFSDNDLIEIVAPLEQNKNVSLNLTRSSYNMDMNCDIDRNNCAKSTGLIFITDSKGNRKISLLNQNGNSSYISMEKNFGEMIDANMKMAKTTFFHTQDSIKNLKNFNIDWQTFDKDMKKFDVEMKKFDVEVKKVNQDIENFNFEWRNLSSDSSLRINMEKLEKLNTQNNFELQLNNKIFKNKNLPTFDFSKFDSSSIYFFEGDDQRQRIKIPQVNFGDNEISLKSEMGKLKVNIISKDGKKESISEFKIDNTNSNTLEITNEEKRISENKNSSTFVNKSEITFNLQTDNKSSDHLSNINSKVSIMYDNSNIPSKLSEIEKTLNYKATVNKLVPVRISFDGEKTDYILWFEANKDFISKLPSALSKQLTKELKLIEDGASCEQNIAGTETITDQWKSCSGAINKLQVNPNPVKTNANVIFNLMENRNCRISIHDLMGKKIEVVADYCSMGIGEHSYALDVANLTPGMYYLVLDSELGEVAMQRFVVE